MSDPLQTMRCLIVDDFAFMRTSLKEMLRKSFQAPIDMAANGPQALEALEERSYDIILCDYHLGDDLDGQQLLEEARERQLLKAESLFIMITAETSLTFVMSALEQRPDDYLAKPVTKEVLLHRLKKLALKKAKTAAIQQAIQKKNYQNALELCKQKMAQEPFQNEELLKLNIEIHLKMGELEKAIELYQLALAGRPLSWARFGLAKIHYQQQRYQQAHDIFTALIKENRFYVEAIEWLSNCQAAMGQDTEAQKTLEKATSLAPKNIQRQKKLAHICLKNQDEIGASTALKACIRYGKKSFFKSSQEYIELANIHFASKQQNKAILLLKDARKIFKTDSKNLLNTLLLEAEFQLQEKHFLDAKRLLSNLLRMLKKPDIYFEQHTILGIAQLCYHLKEKQNGLETLKKLIGNNHDNKETLESINELLETLSEHPSKPIILEHSKIISQRNDEGVSLFESGKLEQAQQYFLDLSEQIPFNRSITINTIRIMILSMKNNLVTREVIEKTRQLLARLNSIAPNEPQLPILQNALDNL